MTPRTDSSPASFKQALERRLRSSSATGGEMARRRQLVVCERFFARVDPEFGDRATLTAGSEESAHHAAETSAQTS